VVSDTEMVLTTDPLTYK